jgi:hypothetical protein
MPKRRRLVHDAIVPPSRLPLRRKGRRPDGCCFALIGGHTTSPLTRIGFCCEILNAFWLIEPMRKFDAALAQHFSPLEQSPLSRLPGHFPPLSLARLATVKTLINRLSYCPFPLSLVSHAGLCSGMLISMIDMLFYSCPMVVHFIIGLCRA